MDIPKAKLVSKSFKTPKGCHVRYVELRPKREAYVGYDCGEGGGGTFPLPEGGGWSNYPKALVKNASGVNVPGSFVTGYGARVDFVLSPRHVTCRKTASDRELTCTVHNADGTTLSRRRRRRR